MTIRVQKLLANAGYFSRRGAEEAIKQGRIRINQKTVQLGDKASIDDAVFVDGRRVNLQRFQTSHIEVIMMNKQAGVICSRKDPQQRRSVFQLLPKGKRWVMVGRLDMNTSGLLLFTTSGELANRLMHPRYQIDREYAVRVLGEVTDSHLQTLRKGVRLDDGIANFKRVEFAGGEGVNRWYKVVLQEGRNREIRRLWEALGFRVSRLIRTRYADISLPHTLRANKTIALTSKQTQGLTKMVGLN